MSEKLTYRELTATITDLRNRLNAMEVFMAGVVALVGKDEILQAASEAAEEQSKAMEDSLTKQVEAGVQAGWLKPIPVSGIKSLVVGNELPANATRPNRMQIVPEALAPKDRGAYIGRQVDEEFTVQSPGGPVQTRILAIYEIDQELRQKVMAEHQAKVKAEQEAAAAAAVPSPSPEVTPDAQPVPPTADDDDIV